MDNSHDDDTVLLTRRRWAWYFGPFTLITFIASVVASVATGETCFLWGPVLPFAMWLMMRFHTPAQGMRARKIGRSPGEKQMFLWMGFVCCLTLLFAVFDAAVLGHGLQEPLQWYHWLVFSGIMVLLIGGIAFLQSRYPKKRP
jgi:hypothetical protein